MSSFEEPCGWFGDFAELAECDPSEVARGLEQRFAPRGSEQFSAWQDSVEILRQTARECVEAAPGAARYGAILEYELPRDDRRPDVVVLENGTVVVIEFKSGARVLTADLDQVRCYARDLEAYHSECHERTVVPVLVLSKYRGAVQRRDGVIVTSPEALDTEILGALSGAPAHAPDLLRWLRGRYDPLPTLTAGARMIFKREPLPRIRRAESNGVYAAQARLEGIATEASKEGSRRLVLLTGVPGSGKTMVGLSFVYSDHLDDLIPEDRQGPPPAVFLSGNGPLIDVLQYVLKSRAFAQPLKHYLEDTLRPSDDGSPVAPPEHVLVFDEAQRAWDAKTVKQKHKGALGRRSEPALLLDVAERIPDWCMVLALIGEGQEIHVGEEAGLGLWAEALAEHPGWTVHAPTRIVEQLQAATSLSAPMMEEPALDLDATLRSHLAEDLHRWVALVLEGELDGARALVPRLGQYRILVTRDLEQAREYVWRRYAARSDPRYGLLASSRAENLRPYTLRIHEERLGVKCGRWYEGRASGLNYCGSLQRSVSEFGCQGLELDFAVVCWGDDLTWTGDAWVQKGGKKHRGAKEAGRLRRNAYRVLMTRGRDGMCFFVPEEPSGLMDPVWDALVASGVEVLADA